MATVVVVAMTMLMMVQSTLVQVVAGPARVEAEVEVQHASAGGEGGM